MSENSQGKPFKTLKLTSMKPADSTGSAAAPQAETGAGSPTKPGSMIPAKPEPAVSREPDSVAPVASAAPVEEKTAPLKSDSSAKDTAKPASFNLVNLKVGGAKKATASDEVPTSPAPRADTPAEVTPDAPVAAKTPPPALSPSAATSAPAGLKPFKFLVPTVKPDAPGESGDPSAHRPQEIKLSKIGSPGLGSVESVPVSAGPDVEESARPSVFALKQASAPIKEDSGSADSAPLPAKAPVAKPSAKPMVLILIVVALVVIAGVAVFFLSNAKSVAPVKPVEVKPVEQPVEPVDTTPAEPIPVPEPTAPANSGGGVVSAPRTRKPELVLWLASAKITTIATQRVTMNDRIYALGAVVNPEGTLRWIGRDSTTKDLLFIDDSGVIYNRPTGGR